VLIISITPTLRILSAPVASPVPDALRQLAAQRSCVANKLRVACASLEPGAAVPWYFYRLKIAETQSALKPIVLFRRFHPPSVPRRGDIWAYSQSLLGQTNRQLGRTGLLWTVEIVIAFLLDLLLKGTLMAQRESALFTVTPGNLSGLAVIFLLLAGVFALLNGQKTKALRANAATPRAPVSAKVNAPRGGATSAQQQAKTIDTEDRVAKAEAALAQAEKEKADLKGKLDASQQEIAALRQRAAGGQTNSNSSAPGTPAPTGNAQSADLQAQVDDLHRQLDGAEKEKELLTEKLQEAQQRPAQVKEAPKAETRKRRETANVQRESGSGHRAGVHGTVLAYNQAYNFVVLNLGARNGVEPNSEMLVLRDGTLIGKIRISSVEPATAIGDIMTNSLARGVQVQPGDNVIYAGTSP
jgi:cell shape-determining protein MreC